jgi:heme/copper-type cytochrome/quinol oxidase subunit 4
LKSRALLYASKNIFNDFTELLPPVQIILVLLMGEIQMTRRLIESAYINSYSPSTMSLVIYLTGIFFYCLQGVGIVSVMEEKSLGFG